MVPVLSQAKWQPLFNSQWRFVQPSWAAVFLITAAMTNSGISLIDTSIVPFQREFVVLIVVALLILAGDTGFVSDPIISRLINFY
jgi:Trk-type K+ transport system membrane component